MTDKLFKGDKGANKLLTTCFCCGEEIVISFGTLDLLPQMKIKNDYYHITLCDDCDEDIQLLMENGIHNVSYDILRIIQEELEDKLEAIIEEKGNMDSCVRDKILLELYKKTADKIHQQMASQYISQLINKDKGIN